MYSERMEVSGLKGVGRKLKIGILAVLVVVFVTILSFAYVKAISNVHSLKGDISSLESRLTVLKEKNAKSDAYAYELKFIKFQTDKLLKLLPPDILQESLILSLRRIEHATGVKMTSIKFAEIEKVKAPGKEQAAEGAAAKTLTARDSSAFADGDRMDMKVEVAFVGKYDNLKNMLEEISREKNRVIITGISIASDGKTTDILEGNVSLTFCALKNSKQPMSAWELLLEKGADDLFKPFEGYIENPEPPLIPEVDKSYKTIEPRADFYLVAGKFNPVAPAVRIGKYESPNSEIYFDGNNTIDINFYIEEKNGQVSFRTRTPVAPYPAETGSVLFFPKEADITMNIAATAIAGGDDLVRVRLNVFNTTERRVVIFTNDVSERVSVVVKEGRVITQPDKEAVR